MLHRQEQTVGSIDPTSSQQRRLGYLSAGPRVSTHVDAAAGPRSHVLGVIGAFRALGWTVHPFIVGDRVPARMRDQRSQATISKGKIRPFIADILRLIMGQINARRAWRELGTRVDWVYERNAALQSLGWIFKKKGIPWILETNAPLFYEAGRERKTTVLTSLVRRVELNAYRRCDVLVCISEALRQIIVEETNIPPHKIVIMPNGVDTHLFDPEKYAPKRLFEGLTVVYVGKLFDWQGVDLLLHAAHRLREENIDIHLVIVGNGPALEALKQLTKALSLTDSVQFVGRVPQQDVPAYIAGGDVGYSGKASMQIGKMFHSPLKLYEYMAMAKPVIASDFEDTRRTIVNGETGYIFEAGNVSELMFALKQVYHEQARLKLMGEKARAVILQNHDWQSRVAKMIDAAEAILASEM